ncbi:MAG: hypothetical protein COB02_15190 [Candidatus Cloacimonadota bacterium]|nr:MAG: hypothetical protein COB02_15190 [Candidatus Cloacimonadota bacterium]
MLIIYLFMVSKVNGSLRDKAVIFVLRFMFLGACLLLFFSSKFETSYRNFIQAKFLYLVDDSFSNKSSIDKKKLDLRLSSLKGVLDINQINFSKGDFRPLFSISKQLNEYVKINKYRAIFLQSDGLEIEEKQKIDVGVPVFTILNKKNYLKDVFLKIKKTNHKFSKNQNIKISLELLKNVKDSANGFIEVFLNNKLLQTRAFEIKKQKQTLSFDFKIKKVGLHKLSFKTKSQSIDYYIEIIEKQKNILVLSNNMSSDLSFYLRALSKLDSIKIYTHYLDFEKQKKDMSSIDLILLYDLSLQSLNYFSKEYSLKNTPKVFVFSGEKTLVNFEQTSFKGLSSIKMQKNVSNGFTNYQINKQNFIPFNLFEHDAYEKNLMSSLFVLEKSTFKAELSQNWKSIFELTNENEKQTLIAINKNMMPATALIFTTNLSSMVFSPLYHKDQKIFHEKMIKNLFAWVLDFDRLKGLEVESSPKNSIEGDGFYLKVSSNDLIHSVFKNLDNSEILLEQDGEIKWSYHIKQGNYSLEVSSQKGLLERKLYHVSLDPREINIKNIDTEYLKKISDLSGGKFISSEVIDLSGYIPFHLKEKKLELVRKEVDLQDNQYYLFLMIFLLCFEWLYRFQRRLV